MSFYQELPYPVYISTGGVLTSGKHTDLKSGQMALLNAETYLPLGLTATAVENPRVVIASGSWHTTDSLTKFLGGLKAPVITQEFLGKDVQEFSRSYPLDLKQDIIQIGWDGVNNCDSLTFQVGKTYRFKINVSGEDVFRTYSRPLYRYFSITIPCDNADDCTTTCTTAADQKKWANQLISDINNDPELLWFVKAELVSSDYSAPAATHRVYQLQLCDNGDSFSLAQLQQTYPTKSIERVNRVGSTSFYQFCDLIATGAPSSFTPTAPVYQAVCGACPTGYTTVTSKDVYVVRRPLAGNEALTSTGAKQTFANTVATAYSAFGSTGVFLGQDGAVALIQFSVTAGTVPSPLLADVLFLSHNEPAKCTPPANSAVAWTNFADRYRTTRVLYLTLNKACGTSNRLSDLQAFYSANTEVATNVTVTTAGTCMDTYQITQYSNSCIADDCLSTTPAVFNPLPSFEGFSWTTDIPCDVPTVPGSQPNIGIRLIGAYADTKFGNCSFEPTDYFSVRPLRIEFEQVQEDGSPCADKMAKVTRVQYGQVSTQSGEWLIRQYITASTLEAYGSFYHDPRTRDIMDRELNKFIDRNKRYVVYYIVYKQDRFGANWDSQHTKDKFETMVAFPEGTDTSSFENLFGGYFSQFGVVLKNRG